jgi:hypothetical protein
MLTASYMCGHILLLSTINSGKRDEIIKKLLPKNTQKIPQNSGNITF